MNLSATPDDAGTRLDSFLTAACPDLSRSAIQRAIKAGAAEINGKLAPPGRALKAGDAVTFAPPEPKPTALKPEPIPLSVLHEDADLIVLDKPSRMPVHPAPGHSSGTLANALLHRFGELSDGSDPDRPGIVHRLDADTTGVILVARNDRAHRELARQFAERIVKKTYLALVEGEVRFDADRIDLPLGPHLKDFRRQAVRHDDGKSAQTEYHVEERFGRFTLLRLHPRTGRTHQIRVHCAVSGFPVLCDRLYGRRDMITASVLQGEKKKAPGERPVLARQALHAASISLLHPATGEPVSFEAPTPPDIATALELLRNA